MTTRTLVPARDHKWYDIRKHLVVSASLIVLLALTPALLPGAAAKLNIISAYGDLSTGTLTIAGQFFGPATPIASSWTAPPSRWSATRRKHRFWPVCRRARRSASLFRLACASTWGR